MIFCSKAPIRKATVIIIAAILVLVLLAGELYLRSVRAGNEMHGKTRDAQNPSKIEISAQRGALQQQGHVATLPQESSGEVDRAQARGTGYVWGTALRALFASATIASDGNKELDISNLKSSFQGHCPIELADSLAPPSLRADYLASTITAALDRPPAEQPVISNLLERYFAADYALRDLDRTVLDGERSKLSRDARFEIEGLLPVDAQAEFEKFFASPTFLFVTMCVTGNRIFFQIGSHKAVFSGNATVTIEGGNSFSVNADEMTSEASVTERK